MLNRSEYRKQWYQDHREAELRRLREWRENNPEKARASWRKRRTNDPEGFKAYHRDYMRKKRAAERAKKTEQPIPVIKAATVRREEHITDYKPRVCTCGDYRNCTACRNAERRAAWKENRVPVYMQPVYSQITAAAGD
jgi:hypothetical protein